MAVALSWAERHNYPLIPVATGGCWSWRGKLDTQLQPDGTFADVKGPLEDLMIVGGRETYLWPDTNVNSNLAVFAAQRKLIEELLNFHCTARRVVRWPKKLPRDGINGPDDFLGSVQRDDRVVFDLLYQATVIDAPGSSPLGCSTAELFAAREKNVDWLCWPFAAVGFGAILDALPKLGKTVFLLHGIHASRLNRPFLSLPTKPMRVVYVSEQSKASLGMQAREVGFTGEEPVEELLWITREDWSRCIYTDFLVRLEKEILAPGNYNCLVIDTFHTVARMEDEKDASEVNRLGNLTIDVATRNNLALALGRHDRKSVGEIGVSGRSSIQLSGLVDVILHLLRVPNQATQRKLELLGRIPGLPNEQLIDLVNGVYVNWGEPEPVSDKAAAQVAQWLEEDPKLTGKQIVAKFASLIPPVEVSLATANRYKAEARAKQKK